MKKVFLILLILTFSLTLTGCSSPISSTKQTKDIIIDQDTVKNRVKGWGLYTNPAFRYELRHPKTWQLDMSDDIGTEVTIHDENKPLTDQYFGEIVIKGFVNWRTQYNLEQYYQNQTNNLFEQGFEQAEVEIDGQKATWFKEVDTIYQDQEIDVITFDLDDRIVEIYLIDDSKSTITVLNSLTFYGNKTISDLEGAAPLNQVAPWANSTADETAEEE
jgi:hypothetical protein